MNIDAYIESKRWAWSESTKRSERYRLNAVAEYLNGNPELLWNAIKDKAPYTRLTIWTRVVDYWDFKCKADVNPYRHWKEENAKAFKHCYTPRPPVVSLEEARKLIATLDEGTKEKALQLLEGGLRYSESFTVDNGRVVGKGGKERQVFTNRGKNYGHTYRTFLRKLKSVGLTPHMLRKICATHLAQNGLGEADLCSAMGWASFATAKAYVAANKGRIEAAFASLQEVDKNDGETPT